MAQGLSAGLAMVTLGPPNTTPKTKRGKPDFSKYGDLYKSPEERGSTYHHRPDISQFIEDAVEHKPHQDMGAMPMLGPVGSPTRKGASFSCSHFWP